MYLDTQEREFDAFLIENEAFWREHTGLSLDAKGSIYVDLAHDNPAYLLTNLWIAKYLQRARPAKIIGLASAWPQACPHYSFEAVKRLAASFLINDVIDLDQHSGNDENLVDAFACRIDGVQGQELRKLVLTFGSDFDPDLGWILYDTWLRQERLGTVETAEVELVNCARRVISHRNKILKLMRNSTAQGAVVGHHHYNPYAWIAREVTRQKAPVLFQSLLLPVSIRRFATEEDFRRGRPADFLMAYRTHVSREIRRKSLDSFERRMFDIQKGVRQFFRAVPNSDTVKSRQALLHDLGLDATLPTVCFFVPALCGPAHCFGPIYFDDNGDWLQRSLGIAADTPSVNFLVKSHPQDAFYDVSNLVERSKVTYEHYPNIRFLPPDMPINQVAAISDVAVTVSGTPGYELAARGIATISAGPSRYSELGFAKEPASYEEYKMLLENPRNILLRPCQKLEAISFFFFELSVGRSQTIFIPPIRWADKSTFWTEAVHNLSSGYPEEDPLFRNLLHMIGHNLPFLLNTDLLNMGIDTPHVFEV